MKSLKSIPLVEPYFFGKEKKFIIDCIKSGWITTSGKYLNKFELEIKKITKAKYCCALINGSSSLQLAIRSLNPQTSDEILVPSITFVASVNSIKYNSCNPIFMDVDNNYLIDLKKTFEFLKKNTFKKNGFTINKKTKKKNSECNNCSHFWKLCKFNQKAINTFKKYNIKIIEDSC